MFICCNAFGQTKFNAGRISPSILQCAKNIERLTNNVQFDSVGFLRKAFSHEVWINLPYATDAELYELTNFPNKYVRLQAFDLLLMFRDKKDTIFEVLEKNQIDTLEKIQELEGDVMQERTIYEQMLKKTNDWWQIQLEKSKEFLSDKQHLQLKKLQNKR